MPLNVLGCCISAAASVDWEKYGLGLRCTHVKDYCWDVFYRIGSRGLVFSVYLSFTYRTVRVGSVKRSIQLTYGNKI